MTSALNAHVPRDSASVAAHGLSYGYGGVLALDSLDHVWGPGVHALVGQNGAGKTTLMRLLSGTTRPAGGVLEHDGIALDGRRARSAYRAGVGYLPQDPSWYGAWTVSELVRYFAGLRRIPRPRVAAVTRDVVRAVGLESRADVRLSALSGGQRRRAFIAQAMVHDPRVLLLDEPTAGLDPIQRLRVRDVVVELGADRVVILSTHLVEDVASIADGILVLDEGRERWTGTPDELAAVGRAAGAGSARMSEHELGFVAVLASAPGSMPSAPMPTSPPDAGTAP